MSRRPPTTGYERLAQADDSDGSDDDPMAQSHASLQPVSAPRYAPISQPRPHSGMATPAPRRYSSSTHVKQNRRHRMRTNSGVDLKAINARLERWADEIASRFKRGRGKGRHGEEERLEIHHSVFQAPEGVRPITAEGLAEPQPGVMTKQEFDVILDSVRIAIEQGVHPSMISQGSSGSYFARNSDGNIVAVFKPKDEEPYAAGNPKWNKWIHRNLFPCCFGRACLIPNLSYVSEAAAYTLDSQLRTNLVPYTDVVYLASKSFHYPFWDRHSFYRKRKPLPEKPGSFQVFLKGFKDANIFLRENPWPDQYLSGFRTNDAHRNKRRRWADCRPRSRAASNGDSDEEEALNPDMPLGPNNFIWTDGLKQSFREELEKLVILDYIMRNTDRGLDNWMVKVDWSKQHVSIASEPMYLSIEPEENKDAELAPRPVELNELNGDRTPKRSPNPYKTQEPMAPTNATKSTNDPLITIGAIDNSLSWPWKHPDAWRSFPFGWLFLPVDLIGRPFSQQTRDHFLPLLTSSQWWSETQHALRKVFMMDPDFKERMFAKQIAVMKGQAWNVVETLKTSDHGPLELTRRAKVCVWDDLVDVPVAVPMRATSEEIRRRVDGEFHRGGAAGVAPVHPASEGHGSGDLGIGIDEMDIAGAAPSSSGAVGNSKMPPAVDLLGIATPPLGELPHPGRFELSSPTGRGPQSPSGSLFSLDQQPAAAALGTENGSMCSPQKQNDIPAPLPQQSLSRPTIQAHSRSLNMYSPARNMTGNKRERRYSYATPAGRRSSNSIAQQLYGGTGSGGEDVDEGEVVDDTGGDLGYAAAEGMEGQLRKVIVERLEPVKSRNPVFTWC